MNTLADIQLKKEEKLRKKLFSSCMLSSMYLVDLKKEMNKLHFVSSGFLIEMMRSFTYYNRKDLFCYFAVKLIQEKSMIKTIEEFVKNKDVKDKINQSYMKIDTVKNSTDLKKYLLSLVCVILPALKMLRISRTRLLS